MIRLPHLSRGARRRCGGGVLPLQVGTRRHGGDLRGLDVRTRRLALRLWCLGVRTRRLPLRTRHLGVRTRRLSLRMRRLGVRVWPLAMDGRRNGFGCRRYAGSAYRRSSTGGGRDRLGKGRGGNQAGKGNRKNFIHLSTLWERGTQKECNDNGTASTGGASDGQRPGRTPGHLRRENGKAPCQCCALCRIKAIAYLPCLECLRTQAGFWLPKAAFDCKKLLQTGKIMNLPRLSQPSTMWRPCPAPPRIAACPTRPPPPG